MSVSLTTVLNDVADKFMKNNQKVDQTNIQKNVKQEKNGNNIAISKELKNLKEQIAQIGPRSGGKQQQTMPMMPVPMPMPMQMPMQMPQQMPQVNPIQTQNPTKKNTNEEKKTNEKKNTKRRKKTKTLQQQQKNEIDEELQKEN